MEAEDAKILNDPNRWILKKGGAILFALWGDEVAGACALIRHGDEVYELTKMAVTPALQGRGIGRALAEAVIARARKLGARTLYLQTSPILETAVRLYEKLGFRHTDETFPGRHDFCRCGIVMVLAL